MLGTVFIVLPYFSREAANKQPEVFFSEQFTSGQAAEWLPVFINAVRSVWSGSTSCSGFKATLVPEESPNWICSCSRPHRDALLDFLMTDGRESSDLSSCILYGLIGSRYRIIDYCVMVCMSVSRVFHLQPDCLQIKYLVTISLMSVPPRQEAAALFIKSGCLFAVCRHSCPNRRRCEIVPNGAGNWKHLINNSWYKRICSFLVDWICEESHSNNWSVFGRRGTVVVSLLGLISPLVPDVFFFLFCGNFIHFI